ncbi:MAG TPA: efflux RND transporter periplasmic adaptor subunit [Chitinispirillaceae bacterium]|nr:efflux RND transporter periplasmic adaptor subunit [Chitinispirillaceae bacterium]
MKWSILVPLTLLSTYMIQCSKTDNAEFLGSAVIESTTIQVATTAQGFISALFRDEGDQVTAAETLAIIDTVPLVLKKQELSTGREEVFSSVKAKKQEIESIKSDIDGIQREFNRIDKLAQSGAVPTQQRDNLKTQLESAQARLKAQQELLKSIIDKDAGIIVKIEQIEDQLSRCFVTAAKKGYICTRYRNVNEVIGPGNPLYELCTYDTVYADFFVPQPLLGSLKLGQALRVRIDMPKQEDSSAIFIPGTLTWISEQAEFSPKNIQTRESRNELVFRMRCTIANSDGALKRGLPVEIWR